MNCPVCGEGITLFRESEGPDVYRCGACSHSYTVAPEEKREKYGEEYFRSLHRNWFEHPNTALFDSLHLAIVQRFGGRRIDLLDVGCGTGDFLKHVSEKDGNLRLSGIDLMENSHAEIDFIQGDFLRVDLERRFDAIVSLAVIEHIEHPARFVENLYRHLKKDGIVFLLTVNSNSLIYRLARRLNRLGLRTAFQRLYSIHHLQHFTNDSLKRLMSQHSFDILFHHNHNYPMRSVDMPRSGFVLERLYRLAVWGLFIVSSPVRMGMLQTIACVKTQA